MSHGDPSYPGNQLSEDEWAVLNRKPTTSAAINIAKNINVQSGFSVGETLVAVNKRDNRPYTTSDGVTPQKFMIIHKDDCGMVYCKRINQGRLGKGIEIIATWSFANVMFMQDPDVIEHVLLGNEADYDPFAKSRALANLRQRITKYNNIFALRFDTQVEAQRWIDVECQVGFRFWCADESDRLEIEVIDKVSQLVNSWNPQPNGQRVNNLKVRNSVGVESFMSAYEFTTRYQKYYREKPRVFKEEADGIDMSKQRKTRKKKAKV